MATPIKIFMEPTPSVAIRDTTTSIFSIVLSLQKHLPKYGVELIENSSQADLIVSNAGMGDGKSLIDVSVIHGLLWTALQPSDRWNYAVNAHVISTLRQAKKIICPSEWVADVIRRDMRTSPVVIPWAVDHSLFEGATPSPENYVLYSKTRIDSACPIEPLESFAKALPNVNFVSTFGKGKNIRTTGRVIHPEMVKMIRGASVYFSSTLESFGIATLEALSAGVPVVAYDWGGNSELIQNGVNGVLVKPDDIDGLVRAYVYCVEHRDILSENAKKLARQYTWDKSAEKFAEVFRDVVSRKKPRKPKVSVVMPLYNYQNYVAEAIQSVSTQEGVDYELIVVNDGSTDESYPVAKEAVKKYFHDSSIHAEVVTKPNGGVARARNYGIRRAKGDYILCLDSDDKLGDPKMLKILADALDSDPTLGIVYTGLRLMNADGNLGGRSSWPGSFTYNLQVEGKNQVPTCNMFRKEAWRRAGKYKSRYTPAEDAELWTSITTFGYNAKQVTDAPWFIYRLHSGSLSDSIRKAQKKEPNWYTRAYLRDGQWPFAALGNPTQGSWPVRYYIDPVVSVIIPVGPGHEEVCEEAIESVYGQTFWRWELILVDDSDSGSITPEDYPFARYVKTRGKEGAGAARNRGLALAKGKFVVFLDADDYLHPEFIEKTLRQYQTSGRYVYTDWSDSSENVHRSLPYDSYQLVTQLSLHAMTALVPTAWARDIGGFDETLESWEDSDFWIRMSLKEYCGIRLPESLFTYRYQSGKRREQGVSNQNNLKAIFYSRYGAYIRGEKKMCCGKKAPAFTAKQTSVQEPNNSELIRIEYAGPVATTSVKSPITGQYYGRRKKGDIFFVLKKDAEMLPDVFRPVVNVEFVAEETEKVLAPPTPLE